MGIYCSAGRFHLLLSCEIAVKSFATPLRAAVARELVLTHGLTQEEAAEMLGVTQAAISQYVSKSRGRILGIELLQELDEIVKEFASALLQNHYVYLDFRAEYKISTSGCGRKARSAGSGNRR